MCVPSQEMKGLEVGWCFAKRGDIFGVYMADI